MDLDDTTKELKEVYNSFPKYNKEDYKNSIVGIIDILGFTNFVKKYKEEAPSVLIDLFKQEITFTKFQFPKNIKVKILSDTIILSADEISLKNLIEITLSLDNIRMGLLEKGFLCRGALVFGKHYMEKDILVSEAFINAYFLEENKAIYPRIIISDEVYNYFSENTKPNSFVENKYFIKFLYTKDMDGLYIITQYRSFPEFGEYLIKEYYSTKNHFNKENGYDYILDKIREIRSNLYAVFNNIENINSNVKIKIKFNYVLNIYNNFINDLIIIPNYKKKDLYLKIE